MANVLPHRDATDALKRWAQKRGVSFEKCVVRYKAAPTRRAPNRRIAQLILGKRVIKKEWYCTIL